jgi:CRP-like cAMP-binding protein
MSGTDYEKKVKLANLRAFELFEGMDDDSLVEVAKICEEMTVPAGSVIIHEGQAGDKVYLMQEGSVGIYRGECDPPRLLAVPQAPTVFGEMAILSRGRIRTANVKALSPLRLLAIPIPAFDPLLRRMPRLKENLLNLISERSIG